MPPLIRILAGAFALTVCGGWVLAQSPSRPVPSPGTKPLVDKAKSAEALRAAALEVDKRMAAHFQKHKLPVPADADESTLLRRTYLVAVGRIPTLEETREYLADTSLEKHARLVEKLMASDGYTSHTINWLADLLRVKDQFTDNISAGPYVKYLRETVASNKPWDQLSAELLTAEGDGWNGSPQVGYFVRDKGMPLDNTANTLRIFLGTRMECAQCHDHPLARWSRRDFYELAAFFHGIQGKNETVHREAARETRGDESTRRQPTFDRSLYDLINFVGENAHYYTVAGGGRGNIPLPADYQYRDGKPGEVVAARAPYGPTMRMSARREGDDGRQRFVKWMTNPENPQFTQMIANRMWKRVMGRGLVEPVDEFVPASQSPAPELVEFLNDLMRKLNYDLRAFQHTLLLTRSFRFATNPEQVDGNSPKAFGGRQINRLSAEQIWDSLLVLTVGDPDKNLPQREFGDSVVFRGKVLRPGQLTMSQLQRDLLAIESSKKYIDYMKALLKDGGSNGASESMMMGGARAPSNGLARASELPNPPPGDHFLRRFGMSDREVIEGGSREGTVPQVLALMNGEVQRLVVENASSDLFRKLAAEPDDESRVRAMFLAVLSRHPDPEEIDLMLLQIQQAGSENGWRNMLAALLCTHEFMFMR